LVGKSRGECDLAEGLVGFDHPPHRVFDSGADDVRVRRTADTRAEHMGKYERLRPATDESISTEMGWPIFS
jgi:hypothetical protein